MADKLSDTTCNLKMLSLIIIILNFTVLFKQYIFELSE